MNAHNRERFKKEFKKDVHSGGADWTGFLDLGMSSWRALRSPPPRNRVFIISMNIMRNSEIRCFVIPARGLLTQHLLIL